MTRETPQEEIPFEIPEADTKDADTRTAAGTSKKKKKKDLVAGATAEQKAKRSLKELRRERLREITNFRGMLEYYNVTEWDAVIVADGSGTTWLSEAGWGSVLFLKDELHPIPFYGSMSHGTNNVAELLGLLHPLLFLGSKNAGVQEHGFKVHLFSDSKYAVDSVNNVTAEFASQAKSNSEILFAILGGKRRGLVMTAHHIDRNVVVVNKFVHELANVARVSAEPLLRRVDDRMNEVLAFS